jgi:hypothetical protein
MVIKPKEPEAVVLIFACVTSYQLAMRVLFEIKY